MRKCQCSGLTTNAASTRDNVPVVVANALRIELGQRHRPLFGFGVDIADGGYSRRAVLQHRTGAGVGSPDCRSRSGRSGCDRSPPGCGCRRRPSRPAACAAKRTRPLPSSWCSRGHPFHEMIFSSVCSFLGWFCRVVSTLPWPPERWCEHTLFQHRCGAWSLVSNHCEGLTPGRLTTDGCDRPQLRSRTTAAGKRPLHCRLSSKAKPSSTSSHRGRTAGACWTVRPGNAVRYLASATTTPGVALPASANGVSTTVEGPLPPFHMHR